MIYQKDINTCLTVGRIKIIILHDMNVCPSVGQMKMIHLGRKFGKNKCISIGRTYYNLSMGCMQIFPLMVM